jgi:hypothetical protein
MPSIEIRSQGSLDELLTGVAQLETAELEAFVSEVLTLRAKRVAPNLGREEARLLQIIGERLAPELQQKYDELTAKRRAETLTPNDSRELLDLIDQIERADTERTRAIIDLAQLRGVSVASLKTDLGVRAADYA